MKHCQFCNATFTNEDAFQIHLGVGAPAFHPCNDASEMQAKGMTHDQDGVWSIDESLIEHHNNWAYLKPASKAEIYNREMDERNRIAAENRDKPWLPLHDGE